MIEKRICPYHKVDGQPEKTPSLAIYPDGFHCFSCGASGPLEQLGITKAIVQEKKVEDLAPALEYIETLPQVFWRGLEMPVDERYYYIVWPDRSFYLRRNRSPDGPKYLTPGGHKRPPYYLDRGSRTLIVVEGELNAISLAEALPDTSVVSPGGAGNFKRRELEGCLTGVEKVYLIADDDQAGALAIFKLREELLDTMILIKHSLWKDDANDILVNHGKERLREEVRQRLGELS